MEKLHWNVLLSYSITAKVTTMPKYVCIKSKTESVPEGTVIIATPSGASRIMLVQDSDLKVSEHDDTPYFQRGRELPLTGRLWYWREVKSA